METKFVNFNGLEFPGYLNFGILDEKSLRLDGDIAIAEYLLDHTGELVHRVKWSLGCCELETFFEGKRTMQSRYSKCNLKEVLCNEYIVNDRFYENRRISCSFSLYRKSGKHYNTIGYTNPGSA